jgi:hypothetical protein
VLPQSTNAIALLPPIVTITEKVAADDVSFAA